MAHRDAEYQQIRDKATRINQKIKEANQTLCQAEEVTVATLEELNSQNEHLDQIKDRADSVDAKVQHANKQAKYLNKGFFSWAFSRAPKMKDPKSDESTTAPRTNNNTPQAVQQRVAARVEGPSSYDALDTAAMRENGHEGLAKELELHDREYNDGLDEMSRNLERLTQMGLAVGEELDSSTGKIDHIHTTVSKNHEGLAGINARLRNVK